MHINEDILRRDISKNSHYVHALSDYESVIKVDTVLRLIGRTEEKVLVPDYVATWIESEKNHCSSLTAVFAQVNALHAVGQYASQEYRDKAKATKKWIIDNEMEFATAWRSGYTINYVTKHEVIDPVTEKLLAYDALTQKHYWARPDKVELGWHKHKFTEEEIKAIDERLWPLAKEVF